MREILESLDPLADSLRTEQQARWEAGDHVGLETLLARHPGLADTPETVLDLIYSEVLLREEYGERPALQEYLKRFPQFAESLRRQFGLHDAMAMLPTVDWPTTQIDPPRPNRTAGTGALPAEIGPYEVFQEIGRGGMGVVYKAKHRMTGRVAAIKVIRPGDATEEDRARFLLEATAVSTLSHPNIVQIHEVGEWSGEDGNSRVPFCALEYVEGGNLAARINGTPLPPHEAAALLQPLADAVEHAHRRGIVHRDLKPANVLLASPHPPAPSPKEGEGEPEGLLPLSPRWERGSGGEGSVVPKITDFGLAKCLDADSGRTRSGAVMGTPSYMAPEQATGEKDRIGPAADVYALGAVLYEMLTGRPPFRGTTILDTLDQVVRREPVAPRQLSPGIPRDLETICLKCLQKEIRKRYASSGDLADDLKRFGNGEPIHARPIGFLERALKWMKRRPAAAALFAVTGLAVAALIVVWVSFTLRLEEQRHEAVLARGEAEEQARLARRERAEAENQARVARRESEEVRKQGKRAAHLLALTAAAVDEIAINVRSGKTEEAISGNTGSVLFKLASFYARASKTLAGDPSLMVDDRNRLAEQYAVSAVRLLNCAEQVGFFEKRRPKNRELLENDPALGVLRDRADYKRFRERLR